MMIIAGEMRIHYCFLLWDEHLGIDFPVTAGIPFRDLAFYPWIGCYNWRFDKDIANYNPLSTQDQEKTSSSSHEIQQSELGMAGLIYI